jgi:hypothetical protein
MIMGDKKAGQRPSGERAALSNARRAVQSQQFLRLKLPVFDLPRIELPAATIIGADLAVASERWRKTMEPLTAIGEKFRRQVEAIQTAMQPLADQFRWIAQQERKCEQLETVGWLPHRSSPFHLLDSEDPENAELDERVEQYYRSNWLEVSASLKAEIEACEFDQEAKDCFSEALAAHGAGLYRCAPRLLYPEIERVARIELHDGSLDGIASQRRLVAAIGGLTPAEMSSTGVTGLRFYKKLTEHLYLHLREADRVALALADPVPNRHAAVHGLVSYTSLKSSLNAILVADYLLQALSTIKRLARET